MSPSGPQKQTEKKSGLTPQAKRALKEAEQRRKQQIKDAKSQPPEIDGREGPEPTRFGDWEKNGIISDF